MCEKLQVIKMFTKFWYYKQVLEQKLTIYSDINLIYKNKIASLILNFKQIKTDRTN